MSLVNCLEVGPKHNAFLEGDFQRLYGIGINFTGKCELNSKFNAMRILNSELRPLRNSKKNIHVEIIGQNCTKACIHPQFDFTYVNKHVCSILDSRPALLNIQLFVFCKGPD